MATKVVSITSAQADVFAPSAQPQAQGFSVQQIKDAQLRAEVTGHVQRVRESMRRTAYEVIEIGRQLIQIKAKLPGYYDAVCEYECGLDPRIARRIVAATEFAEQRLGDQHTVLENISSTLLYKLGEGRTSERVIEEIIGQAAQGQRVTPADLNDAVKRLEATIEQVEAEKEDVASDLAESRKAVQQSTTKCEQLELTMLRQKEQSERVAQALQSATDELTQLGAEHAELQNTIASLRENPQVIEREVPKIPPGYASVEAAIKDKEKRLRQVDGELAKAQAGVEAAQREFAALQDKRARAQTGIEALVNFRTDIQALASKYTAALMLSMAGNDARIEAECRRVAEHLRTLAAQIEQGTRAKPQVKSAKRR